MHGEPVRVAARNSFIRVLVLGSWPFEAEGTGIDAIEDPMAGSDFTRGNTTGSALAGSTSLFLLRARRRFHGEGRDFRMLVLGRHRWRGDEGGGSPDSGERQARVPCGVLQAPKGLPRHSPMLDGAGPLS